MIERLFTIGVYARTESEFFDRLLQAQVQVFCDIRQRRGVRGGQYAFVNSQRLQRELAARGIQYRYFKTLAPTKQIRDAQKKADAAAKQPKRTRTALDEGFQRRYTEEVLAGFDSGRFAAEFGPETSRIVLFCVEAEPAACHRGLVAARLQKDWGVAVEHL